MSKHRAHSPARMAKVASQAISGSKKLQEIAADHAAHPIQLSLWKKKAIETSPERSRVTCTVG